METNTINLNSYFTIRFSDPNAYRGHHFFQHNRYSLENILYVLQYIKEGGFYIPPGDYIDYQEHGHRFQQLDLYKCYTRLCINFKVKFNKRNSQFNTLKKNFFPDMERMGLVIREKQHNKTYLRISQQGLALVNESNDIDQQMKWARAITKLIGYKSNSFMDSFIKLMDIVDYVSKDELIYFVSYLDYSDMFDYQTIAILIEESRMHKSEYIMLKKSFEEKSTSTLNDKRNKKSEKFDFQNFTNSSTSLWNYLQEMIYFELDNTDLVEKLRFRKSISVNDETISFRRNPLIKDRYLEEHNLILSSDDIVDFHHIIPIYYAGSVQEKVELDRWENLVCIDQNTHAKLTRVFRDNIKISYINDQVQLVDIFKKRRNIILDEFNSYFNEDIIFKATIPFNNKMLKDLNYL